MVSPCDSVYRVICTVPGCNRPRKARGYCNAHYKRVCKCGDPQPTKPVVEYVPHASLIPWLHEVAKMQTDECIQSGRYRPGVTLDGQRGLATHLVLRLTGRPRPNARSQALHSCDNPPCVNPGHLRWGTIADNMRDKVVRNRQARGETHGAAHLSEADVLDIRALVAEGEFTQAEVAYGYKVSCKTISQIVRRQTWRHV